MCGGFFFIRNINLSANITICNMDGCNSQDSKNGNQDMYQRDV